MPLDGLTLNVLVNELEPSLKNSRVLKIYQPNETTVTLQLRLPGKTEILLISADALHPRIHTIGQQPANPLNPPPFCMLLRKYLEPSRLLRMEQQGFDRIIHLYLEGLDEVGQLVELRLVFELMGRQSNLYLVNHAGIILDALKRIPDRGIMPGKPYGAPSDQGKIDPHSLTPEQFVNEIRLLPAPTALWKWIADSFQGFSKLASQEVLLRAGLEVTAQRASVDASSWIRMQQAFASLLAELAQGGTPAWYEELEDFAAYELTGVQGERFSSTNHLVATIMGQRQSMKRLDELKSSLRKQLASHRKRVTKKEAIQEAALKEAEQADLYRHQGELLTASFHLIPAKASSVQVPDYFQEGSPMVTIALDPRLPPSANIQRIFKRYTKAKASQKYTAEQLQKTSQERRYLEDVALQIDQADQVAILKEIESELQSSGYLRKQTKPSPRKAQPWQGPERYLSVDGITILVGRNNRQNDRLTFTLTSPDHLWLHARNVPGSHVAVMAAGEIPRETLVQAAGLAAYFSQSRTSPKVPVDYTLRKHVRKPKGANPGFVHYDEAKTILVNPTDFTWPSKQI